MVYFIQDCSNFHIKIGTAADPSARLSALASGNPCGLVLLAEIEGERTRERQLHEQFKAHRQQGEWFWPHPDIIQFILEHVRQDASACPPFIHPDSDMRELPPGHLEGPDEWRVICPRCGCDCNHFDAMHSTVHGVPGDRDRTTHIPFRCECGHKWWLVFAFHKGNMDVRIGVDADNSETNCDP